MIVPICLLFVVFSVGTHAEDMDIDVPTNVANRSMAVKGQFFCGNNKPYAGATVRLFRVFQANAADDKNKERDINDGKSGFRQIMSLEDAFQEK
ncbi:hypothetical protein WR25_14964 [Diploscapter pachys]|uniref:Transthyretin-like family protein n=1 Tax=Diploscapter pachys TaxID=2018661 RepID=A0A2A2LRZ0_9BILA|nr:hypothetical protein WR25_14964 [Diploscapter pachys]